MMEQINLNVGERDHVDIGVLDFVDGCAFDVERNAAAIYAEAGGDLSRAILLFVERSRWHDKHCARARHRAQHIIQRALKVVESIITYEVMLIDGCGLQLPLVRVTSRKPWSEVCKKVVRVFGGTLKHLECPGYFLVDRLGRGDMVPLDRLVQRPATKPLRRAKS